MLYCNWQLCLQKTMYVCNGNARTCYTEYSITTALHRSHSLENLYTTYETVDEACVSTFLIDLNFCLILRKYSVQLFSVTQHREKTLNRIYCTIIYYILVIDFGITVSCGPFFFWFNITFFVASLSVGICFRFNVYGLDSAKNFFLKVWISSPLSVRYNNHHYQLTRKSIRQIVMLHLI